MKNLLLIFYGILILTFIYFVIRMMFSVYYTPGETVIYNSPQAQKLFPNAMNKIFPTWGYNKAGMYDGQPFKFGQGQFWPQSGKGFKPNKFGSPGASPEGGLRPTFNIPKETALGFWGYSPEPQTNTIRNIYDDSSQHVEYKTEVGWWNDD